MFKIGDTINNRYELLSFIAPGGMGEVWKCEDKHLKRIVAIKFVKGIQSSPRAESILAYEASTGASLIGHPNVVSILDFNKFDYGGSDISFIVMEYVEGKNLSDWITLIKPILDSKTYYFISLLIAWELCKAVEYAHKKGILHRDIKPQNLFISKYGISKVGDFGISKFIDELTRSNSVWNSKTPLYSAPEQWRGEKPDTDTDIYQLGCTIYELFTGKPPFDGVTLYELMISHLNETPKPPNKINNDISNSLSEVILELIEKDKNDRTTLWRLNNIIASEIQSTYELEIDLNGELSPKIKIIEEITDIDFDTDLHRTIDFPDFYEVLSEGIQLILANFVKFKINKKVVTVPIGN